MIYAQCTVAEQTSCQVMNQVVYLVPSFHKDSKSAALQLPALSKLVFNRPSLLYRLLLLYVYHYRSHQALWLY